MKLTDRIGAVSDPRVAAGGPSDHIGGIDQRFGPQGFIDQRAAQLGWTGQAVGGLEAGQGGYHQRYQHGSIYWSPATGAFEVRGVIRDKYILLGFDGPVSLLGYPTSGEVPTFDGIGRLTHFERGSIYWHPELGAFEVHGAIRDKWASLGWERWGYPTCDEVDTVDKTGRVNHFRVMTPGSDHDERSIYWTAALGASAVQGPIRRRWAERGWERSYLGFPTSDQKEVSLPRGNPPIVESALTNTFEHGRIVLWAAGGLAEVPDSVTLKSGPVRTRYAVSGWFEWTLDARGAWVTRGHLRATGADSYDFGLAMALPIRDPDSGKTPAIHVSGSMEGTAEALSHGRLPDAAHRDFDWDGAGGGAGQHGQDDIVRRNWRQIRSVSMVSSLNFDSAIDAALRQAGEDLLGELAKAGLELGQSELLQLNA